MNKKLTGLVIIVIMILAAFGLVACTETPNEGQKEDEMGKFYTLQEAYDRGLLTVKDLQKIASHHADGTYPVDTLSTKVMNAIKEVAARKMRESELDPVKDAKAEDFSIIKYYGTYNGSVVFMINDPYHYYPAEDLDINETIAGVLFHYTTPNRIIVWNNNN